MDNAEELTAISLLADPVRWRLYDYLRSSGTAVGRDEAARAAGISRSLAAFHLDRMAEAGLLQVRSKAFDTTLLLLLAAAVALEHDLRPVRRI